MIDFKDYIQISEVDKIQKLLYYTLGEIHSICESHNLRYSLYFGSLLGAVRHKGIIPWDDDIDIVMPRPDYNIFISILKNISHKDLYIYDETIKGYAYPYAKVGLNNTLLIEEGVMSRYEKIKLYIDIFPMDCVPNLSEKSKQYRYLERLRLDHDFYIMKIRTSPVLWKKPYVLLRLIRKTFLFLIGGIEGINKKTIKGSLKYAYDNSNIITYRNTISRCAQKYEINKNEFNKLHLVEFGTIKCYIFDDYDNILKKIFGDYFSLPPIEKRISNHKYKLYIDTKSELFINFLLN